MKIITKANKELLGRRKQFYSVDAITLNSKGIHLSKSFCIIHDIEAGDRLVFMNDEKDWRFYVDNGCDDGFYLVDDEKKRGGLSLYHKGLLRMIKKSLGEEDETAAYRVVKTIMEQKGKPIYWIMTDKKISTHAKVEKPRKLKIA